ncbi:DEAD/DEAH box helicase [Rudaeicoccus suwonensis]|uniref:ATP-dependent RNA helicase HelY n=1 Tax=Rudaeicoccus suwonensis TaxID=657409 RepID=A0A561EAY5_9MICO|nr:DEAD/DEAH box helicase [Rudaeicoccus suwonensis]TWE12785.1 ATP-dependent RNA helicase HelY [Rudaeicoccus suwonensis]
MPNPVQRDAADSRNTGDGSERPRFDSSHVTRFADGYDFPLDDFQVQGCTAVQQGRGVLVAAPTGSGKTVVGEFAAYLAVQTGRKTFYTTPIKALSNQKYTDLSERYGAASVGLLTGDSSINGEAPIVVMTTEVLRNMIYAGSATLERLGFVVMDEVHYLADRFRGAVWEEVIVQLPPSVQVISLSATVSNAEEFGDWLREVRGDTDVIVEEHRPVPLWQHMMVGRSLYDLFVDDDRDSSRLRVNPQLLQRISQIEADRGSRYGRREDAGAPRGRHGRTRGGSGREVVRQGRPPRGPSRPEVIEALDRDGLLPAITFIFSRVGCEAAVGQLLSWGTNLISDQAGRRIRRLVEERVAGLPEEDLAVLGYYDFVEGLSRGFAAHHAGMLPTFREIVEELFTAGEIMAVFATETLALGINMPARTVVLERLVKYNGETHADITPAEFTQLTGRAGRRGIDFEGHAVVLHSRGLEPDAVAGLASTRTFPLRSSFVPTSNMAVNLVAQVGRWRARQVLEQSFAQFQADRAVVGIARAIQRNDEALEGYAEAMRCHLGDFTEYSGLRRRLSDLEKATGKRRSASRQAAAAVSLTQLTPGDVISVPDGRRAGYAVVIPPDRRPKAGADPTVLTLDAQVRRLTETDVRDEVEPVNRLPIPASFSSRSPRARRDLASSLRNLLRAEPPPAPGKDNGPDLQDAQERKQIEQLRDQLRRHPCHDCPHREQHARWAERWWRLQQDTEGLRRQVDSRTHTVARTFDRICDLLSERGYLSADGERVTAQGEVLQRLYAEKDLLAAECLHHDVWRRLDPASLAAAVSSLFYEPRRDPQPEAPRMPNDAVRDAHAEMVRIAVGLQQAQRRLGLAVMGEPDAGIAWVVHRWAGGGRLETVLRDSDLSAGDFVRRCKQLVDLLDQIAAAATHAVLRENARAAIDLVMRGVVAADRLD